LKDGRLCFWSQKNKDKEKVMKKTLIGTISLALLLMFASGAAMAKDAGGIYKSRCKMCHAFDKKRVGPAFKDMNKDAEILKITIMNGRKMMPNFSNKLSEEEIDAMVKFIQSKQG